MKAENRQITKTSAKGRLGPFKTPIKGILDIALIMAITTLAVIYLGPIVIDSAFDTQEKPEFYRTEFDYMCSETGRVIQDYVKDDDGNVIGKLYIEYHDNGAFKIITENNERDNVQRVVFYSEENEFLYWIETLFDNNGEVISESKFDSEGFLVSE